MKHCALFSLENDKKKKSFAAVVSGILKVNPFQTSVP